MGWTCSRSGNLKSREKSLLKLSRSFQICNTGLGSRNLGYPIILGSQVTEGSWEFNRQYATPRLLKGVLAVTVLPSLVGWAQPFPDWESSTLGPGAMRLPSDSPSLLSR